MATSLGSEAVTLTRERRTWRIDIESALNTVPVLTARREIISKVGDTVIAKDQNAGTVSRALSAVATEETTLQDGMVITPTQLAEALVAFIEQWELEDNAPEESAEEPAE